MKPARALFSLAAAAGALAAQDPSASMRAQMEAAVAKQLAAASVQAAAVARQGGAGALIEQSIAKQRAAVEKQARTAAPLPDAAPVQSSCVRLPASAADAVVSSAAAREGLPESLLRAVIERESGFRPCAVSRKGALGLMQLLPGTAGDLGLADAFDPAGNVASGARFLSRLIARYSGSLPLALAAYNAGPARVDAAGGVPDIPETRDYVRSVLASLWPSP
jgi:soluble lytic murein transglycosylase-like protein